MALNLVNQADLMLKLLISQYTSSPNFEGLMYGTAEKINQDIEEQAFQIYNMCDIANSTGNVLDAVGSLIGLPRMPIENPGDVWILDQTPFTDHQFGDKAYLYFELAPDDIYRDAIRAYAINQTSTGSLKDLQQTLMLLWGMTDTANLTISLNSSLNVTLTVNVAVDIKRDYLVQQYRTPNQGYLWSKVASCIYNFNYLP